MKPIKLTQSSLAKAKEAILSQLDGLRLQNTKISIQYDLMDEIKEQLKDANYKKPIVYMSASTYLKMMEYVTECDSEIAWHGTVKRGTGDKNHLFYIKNVFLYPQKIAAATVQVDDTKYTQWADKLDTETFNTMRFQGHSHVNMSTFYSGTDEDNKRAFLNDLLDDDFYIFLVTNKRKEHNFEIYDLAQNIIFEKQDIEFKVYLDEHYTLDTVKSEINEFCSKQSLIREDHYFNETKTSYFDRYISKNTKLEINNHKPTIKVKRKVVLLDQPNRDFTKEFPTIMGEALPIRFNGKTYDVFIPYRALTMFEIEHMRTLGWHIREMPVPEECIS